jgi:protocatechuate 3,4-dioxygenase beta subunit
LKPTRRSFFWLIGSSAVTLLDRRAAAWAPSAPCAVTPRQTEGPYFVDERLHRSDIREDLSNHTIVEGLPLRLTLRVLRPGPNGCTPLANALVDVWQCDALGRYSDEHDTFLGYNTRGRKFLRGYQMTDADGVVQFMTIYPGWYSDRAVHVHVKVRLNPNRRRGTEFTSQMYFDDEVTDRVHAQPPYNAKHWPRVRNDSDSIFRDGGERLMLQLTPEQGGYHGIYEITVQA